MIADLWRTLGLILSKRSNVVVRLGGKGLSPSTLVGALLGSSTVSGRRVRLVSSEVSEIKNRQTEVFRPGSTGCLVEIDCHFALS